MDFGDSPMPDEAIKRGNTVATLRAQLEAYEADPARREEAARIRAMLAYISAKMPSMLPENVIKP